MTQIYLQLFTYAFGFSARQQRGQSTFSMAVSGPDRDGLLFPYFYTGGPIPPSGRLDEPGDDERPTGISLLRLAIGLDDYLEWTLRGIAFGFVASHRDRKSSKPEYERNERAEKFFFCSPF